MKRILITGANKGIGLATVAKLLGSYDETFLLLGSRDSKKGQQALNSLLDIQPEWKDRLDLIQIDVEQDLSVNSAAEEVVTKFGKTPSPLYAIVNNAGIGDSMLGLNKVLQVNTFGPKRVCDAFLPLLNPSIGRVVNVTSASGPLYLAGSSNETKKLLTNPEVSWTEIEKFMSECLKLESERTTDWGGDWSAYGISKACTNAYSIYLAKKNPNLTINACTPGFIETDLTRPMAESNGKTPAEMGMKSPEEGVSASVFLLMGNPSGSGHYYGSDCVRSPLDKYRSPGDPPYTG
ncbi:MAG: SDR family NAD(P)-dependent oxidoreductase [Proteobacteria bacterium]|nr:MAG: SDR family NAD(P)-dependent oxidoreductase [Pseudomonadota bacterium]|tara:strand:+ start:3563 stop:4438 length:876 start_codon:yes stop_codon:yes gene_type:complete